MKKCASSIVLLLLCTFISSFAYAEGNEEKVDIENIDVVLYKTERRLSGDPGEREIRATFARTASKCKGEILEETFKFKKHHMGAKKRWLLIGSAVCVSGEK